MLDREHDNLRAVLRWCIESGEAAAALDLVGNLWRFWLVRGLLTEGRTCMTEVLEMPLAQARLPIGRARSCCASRRVPSPAALPRIMRARRARRCGVVAARSHLLSFCCSTAVSTIIAAGRSIVTISSR